MLTRWRTRIADAILGALCEAIWGTHFSDDDPQWKDATVCNCWRASAGWRASVIHLVNADARYPGTTKLRDHIAAMRESLAGPWTSTSDA